MAKVKFVACVFVFVVAVACSAAQAEETRPAEIGLYTNIEGTGATGTFLVGEPVELFLVLKRPTTGSYDDLAYTDFIGASLRMTFDPLPAGNLLLLDESLLIGDPLDIGLKDFNAGYLEFVLGLGSPVPLVGEVIPFASLTFLNTETYVTKVFLEPSTGGYPVPTELEYAVEDPLTDRWMMISMYPVSGGHDLPVFEFNGEALQGGSPLPEDNKSFGSLKALYR